MTARRRITRHIHKARDERVPGVFVHIVQPIPDDVTTVSEADGIFIADAMRLEQALHNNLPGGTYDRLLSHMLARKASHFIVAHGGDE